MKQRKIHTTSVAVLVLAGGVLARAENLAPQPPGPGGRAQGQGSDRDRLIREADELRRAGKLDEAATAAARILELERRSGGENTSGAADALSRLAELHELSGKWADAAASRRAALAVRERVDGKDHWRTVEARLALAFVDRVTHLDAPSRTKLEAAMRKEEESARLAAQGKLAEADSEAIAAFETYRDLLGPKSLAVAHVLDRIGVYQGMQGDARMTILALSRALAIYSDVLPANHPDIAKSLHNMGTVQQKVGDPETAKRLYDRALAIRRRALPAGDPDIARTLTNLGLVQLEMHELAAARGSQEEAVTILSRALPPDHPDIALALNNLGNAQHELGDYAAAKRSHEQALSIKRRVLAADDTAIATSLSNLGNAQYELHELAAAKRSHEEAVAILRRASAPAHSSIATALNNLGAVQLKLGDFADADRTHEEALAISRRTEPPNFRTIADGLGNVGIGQMERRAFGEAQRSLQEALVNLRRTVPADHPDIAKILTSLGNVQLELRAYAAAQQSQEAALAIRRRGLPPGHPAIAQGLTNLGALQGALRQFEAAKRSHEEALAIFRQALPPDHPDVGMSLCSLGNAQLKLHDNPGAKKSLEEALALRRRALHPGHPDIARTLGNLALVQCELREFAAARRNLEEALATLRRALPAGHPDIAASLFNLGHLGVVTAANPAEAATRLTEAFDIDQAEQLRLGVAQAEHDQLITAVRSKSALRLLVGAATSAGMPIDSIYDRVIRAKGSVTAQQRWIRQVREHADPETRSLLERLRAVSREILGLSVPVRAGENVTFSEDVATSIRNLTGERARLEQELATRSGVYQTIHGRARLNSRKLTAALPKDSALIDLIEYGQVSPGAGHTERAIESRLLAFITRPEKTTVTAVPLGSSKDLGDLIDRWRASYGTGKRPLLGAPDPARALRSQLWEPLAKHLDGVRLVLVSPEGPLNGLPWAALPGSRDGTFLVHDHSIAVVPIPLLLPEMARDAPGAGSQQPSLLLAGGIDFGPARARDSRAAGDTLPPLPFFPALRGTADEVVELDKQFRSTFPRAGAPLLFTGKEATKQVVVAAAASRRYIVLATHGYFADQSVPSAEGVAERAVLDRGGSLLRPEAVGWHEGLLSGVVFAGVNRADRRGEETILTALEVSDLELSEVDLVVLSACATGRGLIAGGEGALGLQRAFELAGARTVVASLWNVPDRATQALMTRFHRNIWEKQMSKIEALREAQIWLIREAPSHPDLLRGGLERADPEPQAGQPLSPFFWAAFVLSGDWR